MLVGQRLLTEPHGHPVLVWPC